MIPRIEKKMPMGKRRSIIVSPEEEVQCDETRADNDREWAGTLVPRLVFVMRNFGDTVNQAAQLVNRLRGGIEAYDDGDQKTGGPGADGDPEILRHRGRERMNVRDPAPFSLGDGQAVRHRRGGRSGDKSGECAVTCGALPKHS